MEFRPEDVRIERFYHGRGSGSSVKATYVPTGAFVGEMIPPDSREPFHLIQSRVLAALREKVDGATGEGV